MIVYHQTSWNAARAIQRQGFRVPRRTREARTDASSGTFFPVVFVVARKPERGYYGPALIRASLRGPIAKVDPILPGENFIDWMRRNILRGRALGATAVDSGRPDYGIWVLDPHALQVLTVRHYV